MANEKSKEVKMKVQEGKNEKLSYEQLEQVAANLSKQCKQLYGQYQEATRALSDFNEIEMLLSILDKSEHFHDSFVERCASKIAEIITGALDASENQKEEK